MTYIIKVTHTAPNFKQFASYGIIEAFPTFYINIIFYMNDLEILLFIIKITGHYYCCGSSNFEDINIELTKLNIKLDNIEKNDTSKKISIIKKPR